MSLAFVYMKSEVYLVTMSLSGLIPANPFFVGKESGCCMWILAYLTGLILFPPPEFLNGYSGFVLKLRLNLVDLTFEFNPYGIVKCICFIFALQTL